MTGMITVFNLRLAAGLTRKQNLFETSYFPLSDIYNDLLYFLSMSALFFSFLSLICKHIRFKLLICLFCCVVFCYFLKRK